MSTSSLSAEEWLRVLPIGAVFVVRWGDLDDAPCKAVWRRHSDNQIELIVDEDGMTDRPYMDDITDHWISGCGFEALDDDETARVLALVALGRGDLV